MFLQERLLLSVCSPDVQKDVVKEKERAKARARVNVTRVKAKVKDRFHLCGKSSHKV